MRKLFFGFLLFLSGSLPAQDASLQEFRRAFKENIDELWAVYNFRGANFICDYAENDAYEDVVFRFLKAWDSAPKKPLLVFYSKSGDSLTTWLFSSHIMQVHHQYLTDARLLDLENELRKTLQVDAARGTNLVLKGPAARNWEVVSQELSDILLPAEFRTSLVNCGHLFVLPELNIGQIPFWVLKPFGNVSYLCDSFSYSFVPHVCQFTVFTERYPEIGRPYAFTFKHPLIVGNPPYSSSLGLPQLEGAAREAAAVADLLGDTVFGGAAATRNAVVRQMKYSDLIYLATHASCSMENILDSSWIALAGNEYNDGRLYLKEVQRMMLTGRMAVLSACQTGYGKVLEGGFVGLGRAFFKTGIDFTVMSLWSVSDEATFDLMTGYMKYTLQPGYFQPAESLRKAIVETRSKYSHPAYWAPFVLFGFTY